MKLTTIPHESWYSLYLTFAFLLVASLMVLTDCGAPAYLPAPSPSSPSPTPSPTPEPPTPVESPPITIALDYFGIQDTHHIPQVGGDQLAKIQLIAVVRKTKADRSLLFIIPMSPVTKAAPDMPARTIVKATARAGLNPGPSTSKPVKTSAKTKNRKEAITNPTDHLPQEVLGKTLICTMES